MTLIYRHGACWVAELTTDNCPPPNLVKNGSASAHNDPQLKNEYSHVREVKFLGSVGPMGERRLCKIKCIAGQWVGPLCVDQQGRQHVFLSCYVVF